MNVALLVLRIVVGALFVGHGCQKLFGWFHGRGPRGTASVFESVGIVPALPLAVIAGLCGADRRPAARVRGSSLGWAVAAVAVGVAAGLAVVALGWFMRRTHHREPMAGTT